MTSSASLSRALAAAERILKPDGRLVVITFHSLEDRIVKTFLAERANAAPRLAPHAARSPEPEPSFRLLTRRPVVAGRRGSRRQSARALGEAACRRAHRGRPDCGAIPPSFLPRLPALDDVAKGR